MPEPLTISNAPLPPGMDYAFLRQEGIKLIEKLAGSRWTDYNAHDPGITILEALCYAITDLSYRLSHNIEDLLAFPPSDADRPPLFLTARDILTVNPLTLNDYRKLLLDIDIDGVKVFKNAWLELIENPQPAIFYDANNGKLTFSNLDSFNPVKPVHLQGLYRVMLEKHKGLSFQDNQLIAEARTKLHQHRNLCEDFADIKILDSEKITVRAEIEIVDHVDPNQLIEQLYTAIDRTISPAIDFLSLPDLLNKGIPIEDIFTGPRLKHGFIDDTQLEQFQRQTELRTSDLIHAIMDLPGVKTVISITIASDQSSTPKSWDFFLDSNRTPQLKPLVNVIADGDITFYKGQIACQLNKIEENKKNTQEKAQVTVSQTSSTPVQDIPIPTGEYRELADYESLQSEFPMAYGIGELGLPASATPLRKAQAKQLQAYLMVFDQILANYLAQLDHIRELFALSNAEVKTYFTQSIAHFPGAKEILQQPNEHYLQKLSQDPAIDRERKNRLLDHLIAQYGETFIDHSLLHLNTESATATIQHKANFAEDYRQVSANRGQAVDCTIAPNQSKYRSGLDLRIAQLLAIQPEEDFYIIEHILLRPRFIPPKKIAQFSQSNTAGYVTCTSPKHRLQQDEKITILFSEHYNGVYTISNVTEDSFEIQATFNPNYQQNNDAWLKSELLSLNKDQHPDPFSFQVSVIFSDSSLRFKDQNFKEVVCDTLIAETPAHITLHVHWLDLETIKKSATDYSLLLENLSSFELDNSKAAVQETSTRLIDSLKLGSTKIPPTPAVIGHMVIGDASKGAPIFVVA